MSSKPPEYKILRMYNGDILISSVTSEKNKYILFRPMTIISVNLVDTNTNKKQKGIGLKDWMEYSSDGMFYVLKSSVVTVGTPDEDIVELYEEAKIIEDENDLEDEIIEKMKKEMRGGITGNNHDKDDLDDEFNWKNTPRFPK